VNPETLSSAWSDKRHEINYGIFLEEVLSSGKIADKLQKLLPFSPDYALLRNAYRKYIKINKNGGWPTLPSGNVLKKGDISHTVPILRKRLEIEYALELETSSPNLFDNELEKALVEVQLIYGLDVTGILDKQTINALNISSSARARQIALNMERWRWLPQNLGSRYVLINIADYMLYVIKNRETILKMKAIVGRHYRQTPLISKTLLYCVFNPYWNVPKSIAVKDLLPKIKQNPQYLVKNHFKVFRQIGLKNIEINPLSINWARVNEKNFSYSLRQEPGAKNALGRIKFVFPNKYDVYIHDTPEKEFFKKNTRAFSSGCIRIEKPFELAQYLLSDKQKKKWTNNDILQVINKGKEYIVFISPPIPVHILYWTAWINRDGSVNFRDDIYNRDASLAKALFKMRKNNK
jgi:murein L,D-transpeptidase YcbB/YkuD